MIDYDQLLEILRRTSEDYGTELQPGAYRQGVETLSLWFNARGIPFEDLLRMGHKMVENQIRAMIEGLCSEDQVPLAIYIAGFQLGWEAHADSIAP